MQPLVSLRRFRSAVVASGGWHRPRAALPSVDPVTLTVLAVNQLAPATLRTSTSGRALTITVPDPGIAAIFRAALSEMQKARGTDRLVKIVVSEGSKAA